MNLDDPRPTLFTQQYEKPDNPYDKLLKRKNLIPSQHRIAANLALADLLILHTATNGIHVPPSSTPDSSYALSLSQFRSVNGDDEGDPLPGQIEVLSE